MTSNRTSPTIYQFWHTSLRRSCLHFFEVIFFFFFFFYKAPRLKKSGTGLLCGLSCLPFVRPIKLHTYRHFTQPVYGFRMSVLQKCVFLGLLNEFFRSPYSTTFTMIPGKLCFCKCSTISVSLNRIDATIYTTFLRLTMSLFLWAARVTQCWNDPHLCIYPVITDMCKPFIAAAVRVFAALLEMCEFIACTLCCICGECLSTVLVCKA